MLVILSVLLPIWSLRLAFSFLRDIKSAHYFYLLSAAIFELRLCIADIIIPAINITVIVLLLFKNGRELVRRKFIQVYYTLIARAYIPTPDNNGTVLK